MCFANSFYVGDIERKREGGREGKKWRERQRGRERERKKTKKANSLYDDKMMSETNSKEAISLHRHSSAL